MKKIVDALKAAAEASGMEMPDAPTYEWSSGQCIATADCGGAVPDDKSANADKAVKYTYECGATTLAASMLATAAIAFTM